MHGNASVSQYIYIHIASTLVKALTCYDRGSWFEPSDRQGYFSFSFFIRYLFIVQTDLKIGIHGIYDKKFFDKKKHFHQTSASASALLDAV